MTNRQHKCRIFFFFFDKNIYTLALASCSGMIGEVATTAAKSNDADGRSGTALYLFLPHALWFI